MERLIDVSLAAVPYKAAVGAFEARGDAGLQRNGLLPYTFRDACDAAPLPPGVVQELNLAFERRRPSKR